MLGFSPEWRMSSRTWHVLLVLAIASVGLPGLATAQVSLTGELSRWAVLLSIVANGIRVAEVIFVMYGVYQYVAGRQERRENEQAAASLARKAANFQAWQVVNSAQGKGGSGGRIDALHDLATNGVSLAGVHLDDAWLEGVDLQGASLSYATFVRANLQGARLQDADLQHANFTDARMLGAQLAGAFLKGADLSGAHLSTVDFRGADLTGVRGWDQIRSISYANIEGVRNAPPGFREWAVTRGADEGNTEVEVGSERSYSTEWRVT